MGYKEKHIGESKLTEMPKIPLRFKIKPNSITNEKLANESVTEDKLSEDLRDKINNLAMRFSLGFYNDDNPPTPLLMLTVRPGAIDKVIKPYLLQNQIDVSAIAKGWEWERESDNHNADLIWNASEKAHQRILHLTDQDFPTGWEISSKLAFKCTVIFEYESEQTILINVITII